jgi:hypothetical protein
MKGNMTANTSLPEWFNLLARIGKKEFNQFCKQYRSYISSRSSEFLTQIMHPHVYADDCYFSISDIDNRVGRNQNISQQLAAGTSTDWSYPYFTNALLPVDSTHDLYRFPSKRVTSAPFYVLTYEFDNKDIAFFRTQCSWVRSNDKKDTDCKIGDLFFRLSQYGDFKGITVNWSGNKSFHIHCVFDPTIVMTLSEQFSEITSEQLREGFIQHWDILKEVIMEVLDPRDAEGEIVHPDRALRLPEAYRRLPGGIRLIEPKANKPDWQHTLGIPFGTRVPQMVMWEKWRRQSSKVATGIFFRPAPFFSEKAEKRAGRNASVAITYDQTYTPDEIGYIADQMRIEYPAGTYPEFSHLTYERGHWIAYFRNSATDRNPSSIMRDDYFSISLNGSGSNFINEPKRLPRTLGAMMIMWREQYRSKLTAHVDTEDEIIEFDPAHAAGSSDLEQGFKDRATSKDAVMGATKWFFGHAIAKHPFLWVKGPEGGGKSSSVMKLHLDIVRWLRARQQPTLTMYAFTDYVNAEEKCAAFNELHVGMPVRGVVIKSFWRLYEEACHALGLTKISHTSAGGDGFSTLWAAIEQYQPSALKWMADHHAKVWAELQDKTPVFFTVHLVAHSWKSCPPTRIMWAPDFWENGGKLRGEHEAHHREATMLGMLVHDEVSKENILAMHRAEVVEWVQALALANPPVWTGLRTSLADTLKDYTNYVATYGFPMVDGEAAEVPFNIVREIVGMGVHGWEEALPTATGAYPESHPNRPLYTGCVSEGHRWMVKPKVWWRSAEEGTLYRVAHRVIVLTTETLPTAVAQRADARTWQMFSLETPHLHRSEIDVIFDEEVTSAKMKKTCTRIRSKLLEETGSDVAIISDKVKEIEDTQSHISARGSNDYLGKDVLQTMSFLHPNLHEELLVLNAYTGRDDCVVLWHMDRFNQTAGRNMGFRHRGTARHYLLTNPRLFSFLLEGGSFGLAYSRYDLTMRLNQRQRVRIKAKAR